jgi:hypothetical protein
VVIVLPIFILLAQTEELILCFAYYELFGYLDPNLSLKTFGLINNSPDIFRFKLYIYTVFPGQVLRL